MSLVTETQQQINESGAGVFWPLASGQVYDALNSAIIRTYAHNRDQFYVSTPLTFASGVDILALPTTTVMIPQYIVTPGAVKIFPTTMPMLQDWNANWKNTPHAQPQWIVLWDWTHLRSFPIPDQTYTYTLYGVPWPLEIGTGGGDVTDITNIDPLLRQAIIHRACATLLEYTQPQLADVFTQEAEEHEKRYRRQARNAMGDNVLRLRPGVGWSIAQSGDIRIGKKYGPQGGT